MVLMWIAAFAVLVWIGFLIYQSVMDYIENSESSSEPPQSSVSDSVSQPQSSSAPSQVQETEPLREVPVKAVVMSDEIYRDSAAMDAFLKSAAAMGANTVAVDYKDREGIVYHDTAVAMAIEGKAVSPGAVDLSEVAKAIRDAGLIPAARIYGFEDHTVSYQLRDVAGHYKDEDYLWYDNSPDKDGKAWLNPYNADARGYLTDLAAEAAEIGFEEIIMPGVHFPKGYQLEAINFGDTGGVSKSDLLRSFAGSLEQMLTEKGARLSIVVLASDISAPNGFTYGEDSALDIFDGQIYLDLSQTGPSDLPETVQNILTGRSGKYGAVLSADTASDAALETLSGIGVELLLITEDGTGYPETLHLK